jgi:hypothetical protein
MTCPTPSTQLNSLDRVYIKTNLLCQAAPLSRHIRALFQRKSDGKPSKGTLAMTTARSLIIVRRRREALTGDCFVNRLLRLDRNRATLLPSLVLI